MRKLSQRTSLLFFSWFLLFCPYSLELLFPAQAERRAPKVGLALSGGGARGAAHIGVLKVIESEGIPVDYIAGSSFGALVGAFYALGYPASEIETIFTSQDWDSLFSDSPDRRLAPLTQHGNFRYLAEFALKDFGIELPVGLWGGQKLIEVLNFYTTKGIVAANYDFDRLKIPFRAVATDLLTGKPYVFRNGRLTEALRASAALPMVFTPVEKDDMLLVDGGLVNDLPADIAREMGADIVIAVDVTTPLLKKDQIRNFVNVMDQMISLQMKRSVETNLKFADIVVRPDLEGFSYGGYAQVPKIAARGAEATLRLKNELHHLIGKTSPAGKSTAGPSFESHVIDSITFQNLERIEEWQLLKEVESRPNQPVDLKLLQEDLARLYATRLFDTVDYHLQPTGANRYRLSYVVKESAMNSLGGSIRYDRDYKFVALAEINARGLFHTPSMATLSSQFGGLENHNASLRLIHPKIPLLFLQPQIHLAKRERLDRRETELVDKFTHKRRGGELSFGGLFFKRLAASAAYRFERAQIIGGTEPKREEEARNLAGLRLRLFRDTLDAQDYPNSGMQLSFQMDNMSKGAGGDFSYSSWQGDFQHFFALAAKSILRIHVGAVYSRGAIPFFEQAFVGGYNSSEGASRQLLGYSRDELTGQQALVLGASYRHRIFSQPLSLARRGYLYLHYNVAGLSQRQARPYGFTYFNGVGAGLLLDTIAGPVRLVGGWGEQGRASFYLSLGPSF